MLIISKVRVLIVFLSLLTPNILFTDIFAQSGMDDAHQSSEEEEQPFDLKTASLEEVNRRMENPLTSLWSLVFQENFSINNGSLVDGNETSNTFFFQPALPIQISNDLLFIARPVFPLVTQPVLNQDGSTAEHKTGYGDTQLFAVLGPNKTDGIVWGAGATLIFPTASDEELGQEKYQAGPAMLTFYLGKPWTLGILAQQWWSYAGDETRADTNRTDIQYVCRRQIPGGWSIGMGPTVSINWEAESDNRVTFPIGLGITKTVRWGGTPIKLRLEPQYSIIKPDDFGTEWNIRLQIAPVIQSPFN
jgi:hypothetical protein